MRSSTSLLIAVFEGVDLAPLSSLRRVSGRLLLGSAPQEFPADPDEVAALQALQDAGVIDSLHGLEALESVGTLQLSHLRIEDVS